MGSVVAPWNSPMRSSILKSFHTRRCSRMLCRPATTVVWKVSRTTSAFIRGSPLRRVCACVSPTSCASCGTAVIWIRANRSVSGLRNSRTSTNTLSVTLPIRRSRSPAIRPETPSRWCSVIALLCRPLLLLLLHRITLCLFLSRLSLRRSPSRQGLSWCGATNAVASSVLVGAAGYGVPLRLLATFRSDTSSPLRRIHLSMRHSLVCGVSIIHWFVSQSHYCDCGAHKAVVSWQRHAATA
mmetsp:Transcript_32709/g.82028  ORF Transcript_32709/g.82028 Transcript_32709/m.82028 type:complete len:240 (+) Transcript_32709:778-1497(+)